ncbi:MAG TPA: Rrf2 family transcriptional regulator [Caulobacteraceae bacterium]|nr:Rrf2 family transcriptional regulator [Caulobacteraceae bacterium]
MLSQKARHALQALIALGRAGPAAQLTAGEIAARSRAPRKYLEAILLELGRSQLIISRRGKFGGYCLCKPPASISFAEIIRIIDGPLALAPCASQIAFRKCDDCEDLETCPLRPALVKARDATAKVLEAYTLAEAIGTGGPGAA